MCLLHFQLMDLLHRYRGIGAGWARGVFGGSTGGWESLAAQVLYPDEFNYAAAACPDPIGFESYSTINIYDDDNAYIYDGPFKQTPRPGVRDAYSGTAVLPGTSTVTYGHPYGHTTATVEEMNRREIVLGGHSRSCEQWDVWEAVFSPRGDDGYPARLWCKDPAAGCEYGKINRTVAAHWRQHYDLLAILKRDWHKGLGDKLAGKIHVFVGVRKPAPPPPPPPPHVHPPLLRRSPTLPLRPQLASPAPHPLPAPSLARAPCAVCACRRPCLCGGSCGGWGWLGVGGGC